MIKVTVEYGLSEYLRVLHDFIPLARRRIVEKKGEKLKTVDRIRWYERAFINTAGTVAFFVKSRRIGTCSFDIDAHAISRTSRRGVLQVPWVEISQVYKLSAAYLVEKSDGAMPIPFRVFNEAQKAEFEAFVHDKLLSVQHTT